MRLVDVCEINYGTRIIKGKSEGTKYPVYGGGDITFYADSYNRENELIISRFGMSEKCVRCVSGKFFLNDSGFSIVIKSDLVEKDFLSLILMNLQKEIFACARGNAQKNIDIELFLDIEVPVPKVNIQKQIISEIQKEQEIIENHRLLIDESEKKIRTKILGIRGEETP
jgi:type I restriction enzyme, S subunit